MAADASYLQSSVTPGLGNHDQEIISPTGLHSTHSVENTGQSIPSTPNDPNKTTMTHMSSKDSSPSSDEEKQPSNGRPWRTTFLRWGPIGGIACMLTAICSLVVSLGVLIGSNHAATANWGATPSAILAICTAVANQSLRFAAFQGFVAAWWFGASSGTSLRRLHVSWRAGTTVVGALIAGRNMGLIGLACIMSTLVAIDGPLLQKATTVVSVPITNSPLTLIVSMSPEVPLGFSGGWVRSSINETGFPAVSSFGTTYPTAQGPAPNNVFTYYYPSKLNNEWTKHWIRGDIVPGVVQGCDSVCDAIIRAPAVAQTACKVHEFPVNYTTVAGNLTAATSSFRVPVHQSGFMIAGSLLLGEGEEIDIITVHSDVHSCAGSIFMSACTLVSAIGEYKVTIDHGTLTLADELPRIIALANNTQVNHTWNPVEVAHDSTLGGAVSVFFQRYESYVLYVNYQGGLVALAHGNGVQLEYMNLPTAEDSICPSFSSPKDELMKSFNKLLFNIGASAAKHDDEYLAPRLDEGLSARATTKGYRKGNHTVFRTNLRWFAAAAAVEVFCIALILPTYIGFWRLGRPVSFSPLETAKAFAAPLFADCNSNSSGNDMAKVVGDGEVVYGATRTLDGQTKLAFAHPSVAERPRKDVRFDI